MNCPDNILVGNGIYDDTDAIQAAVRQLKQLVTVL